MDLRVGYIGLGLMGKSIASNLLKAGFRVTVHNRSQAPVQALVALGARGAASPRQVAEASDVVMTSLPDSPDVEQVVLGPDGVRAGMRPGMVFIDNSTIKPQTARQVAAELAAVGVAALDAPVSGGDVGARAGTLAIMVGGPREAFERALPVFRAMGKTITYVGESGAGQVAKACNQIMAASQMVAMAELLLLAQKSGVDPRRVVEAIRGGAAQCWTLDVKPPRLFAGDRRPGFKAGMMRKDLGIVLEAGEGCGMPLPASALNLQFYEAMLAMGLADQDNSGVIGVLEAFSGVRLEEPDRPGASATP